MAMRKEEFDYALKGKSNLTLTRGPAKQEEKLGANGGWPYIVSGLGTLQNEPVSESRYIVLRPVINGNSLNHTLRRSRDCEKLGGIMSAARVILSHGTSGMVSNSRYAIEPAKNVPARKRQKSEQSLSTAGDAKRLSPRQGRVKVCGPEGKAINIDPMEYDTINITHLQREPNVIGREPREKT
ncbi:hypothetical protein B0H19DRAFT_1083749 [Mycena capillaripes]|nr:hypothetical protein B0H19DRAFT_1083749 [Mycena capillaripes]